ncbi:MAG TPA: hypothetical protein VMU08_00915 [Rhizomicrobium sp.]|nr:hypothetical protein [Rhizomicrobium sp.]
MNFKRIATALAFLALGGCIQPTAYQPATNGHGYSDQRLAENRYRVSFSGNSVTKREMVENFLLLRSAEVTRDAGYCCFVFDNRDTEAKTSYYTAFGGYPGWGPAWGPGFGWYRHNWVYDPWDPYWAGTVYPSTRYEAYAEIVMLTPEQAQREPRALKAADVISRIGPLAAPPPPPATEPH